MKKYMINDFEFLVGNNQQENQKLLDESCQTDIWFHLDKLASPHGILKCELVDLTKTMATQCCLLIKENSKYKNIKSVSVIYCPMKGVRKTEVPGKVILKGKTKKITI